MNQIHQFDFFRHFSSIDTEGLKTAGIFRGKVQTWHAVQFYFGCFVRPPQRSALSQECHRSGLSRVSRSLGSVLVVQVLQ